MHEETYRGFRIVQIWKGTSTNEDGVTREDDTFTYSSPDHETGVYGASLQECKKRIDEYLKDHFSSEDCDPNGGYGLKEQ